MLKVTMKSLALSSLMAFSQELIAQKADVKKFKEATRPHSITTLLLNGKFVNNDGSTESWLVWLDRDKHPTACFAKSNNITVLTWNADSSVITQKSITPRSYASFEIGEDKFAVLPLDISTLVGGNRPNPEICKEIFVGKTLGLYVYMPSSSDIDCYEGTYVLYKKGSDYAITAKDAFGSKKKKVLAYLSEKPEICAKIKDEELSLKTEESLIELVKAYDKK